MKISVQKCFSTVFNSLSRKGYGSQGLLSSCCKFGPVLVCASLTLLFLQKFRIRYRRIYIRIYWGRLSVFWVLLMLAGIRGLGSNAPWTFERETHLQLLNEKHVCSFWIYFWYNCSDTVEISEISNQAIFLIHALFWGVCLHLILFYLPAPVFSRIVFLSLGILGLFFTFLSFSSFFLHVVCSFIILNL